MMRLFTFLALFLITSLAFGQVSIIADVNPASKSGLEGDFEIVAKVNVINMSTETKNFTWVRDESGFVAGWTSGVCDKVMCWFETVSTKSFELMPGDTSILDVHLYPNGFCGNGFASINLTDNNDPKNTITVRYDFEAATQDGSECIKVSVKEFKLEYVKVFPNPASDIFMLTEVPSNLEFINVYNILGSKIKSFTAVQNAKYDISDLKSGLYLLKLTNAKGENLNTIKLHKS